MWFHAPGAGVQGRSRQSRAAARALADACFSGVGGCAVRGPNCSGPVLLRCPPTLTYSVGVVLVPSWSWRYPTATWASPFCLRDVVGELALSHNSRVFTSMSRHPASASEALAPCLVAFVLCNVFRLGGVCTRGGITTVQDRRLRRALSHRSRNDKPVSPRTTILVCLDCFHSLGGLRLCSCQVAATHVGANVMLPQSADAFYDSFGECPWPLL